MFLQVIKEKKCQSFDFAQAEVFRASLEDNMIETLKAQKFPVTVTLS